MKLFAVFVFVSTLALQPAGAAADDRQKLATADCNFSFRLLKELVKEQPAKNIFISPYSVSTVLQMVANGAAGQTKAEMSETLGTTNMPQDSVNAACLDIQKFLNEDNKNVILTTANAIWARKGVPLKPSFIACNQQFFHATVESMDFTDPRSFNKINAWASDQTHGRITGIIQPPIDPATDLFLANAVYFKGKWTEPFDAKATTNRVFHVKNGVEKNVPVMPKTQHFSYRRGTGFQAVKLPYQGDSLVMYVFLPDESLGLEKLLSVLTGEVWQRITKPGFNDQEGTLVLPKFKIEYSVELNQSLKSLGMQRPFNQTSAEFPGIADHGLFISAVQQKAFVEVNEEGTEAAAVTGMIMMPLSAMPEPSQPFLMIVDRPFLLLIEDQNTGTILFMGAIFDPGA